MPNHLSAESDPQVISPKQKDLLEHSSQTRRNSSRRKVFILGLIFLSAFGSRLLGWQHQRFEARQVQFIVTENYKQLARLLLQNEFGSFFDASSTTSDPDLLGHPPGYSLLLALIFRLAGESDVAVQLFQMICDSLAAVIIFFIASELLPLGVGVIAGLMGAFAPQFSWNSILLLPDTLAALPILLAVYFIARACKRGGCSQCVRLALSLAFPVGSERTLCCWRPFWLCCCRLLFAAV